MVGSGRPLLAESLAQPDLATRIGHPLEQIEGTLKGLDPAAVGFGGVGGAGAGRRHGAFLSGLAGRAEAYPAVG